MLFTNPLLLVVTLLFAVVASAQRTVIDIIQSHPQLSVLYRHLNDPANSRIYNLLSNPDIQVTVLAPLDNAFDELDQMLTSNARITLGENQWRRALAYHVIPDQAVSSRDLADGFQQYPTLYNTMTGSPYVRRLVSRRRYEVPQDLSSGLLIYGKNWNYDILRGLDSPAHFVRNDIPATNGFVHIIDRVLVPPLSVQRTLELRGNTQALQSIRMANAEATFQSSPNVTLLIPTNEALRRFTATRPDITLESLRNILLTHVIPGYYFSYDLANRGVLNLPTKSGEMIQVTSSPGRGLNIGDATITRPNILADSAVIHIIDRVISTREFRPLEEESDE